MHEHFIPSPFIITLHSQVDKVCAPSYWRKILASWLLLLLVWIPLIGGESSFHPFAPPLIITRANLLHKYQLSHWWDPHFCQLLRRIHDYNTYHLLLMSQLLITHVSLGPGSQLPLQGATICCYSWHLSYLHSINYYRSVSTENNLMALGDYEFATRW